MTLTLLIVDDQALVRAGFRKLLESEPDFEILGEAGDGAEAVATTRQTRPNVVIMDIRMPRVDGIEATRRITQANPDVAVLILTTYDLDEYVFDAMRAGASGFLLKDAPPDDLIAGIRQISRGDALLAPTVTRRLIAEFTSRQPREQATKILEQLSQREAQVLERVARGLSNNEIAAELFLGEATVKTHISSLLTKLGCRDRVQLVIRAYESGIVQPGQPG